MAEHDAWSPPNEFEEYRLIRRLGRGGMGEVFLAHDTLLDRPVAVKFVASVSPDDSARERLLVEARASARLQHPNVVGVYRVGELDRRPYIISEYIRGQSLDRLETPIPWERALALGIGLARGLAAAHRRGVLHRDIKPANAIIAEDGEVKLLDFGLAKLTEGSDALLAGQSGAMVLGDVDHPVPQEARDVDAARAAPETVRLIPTAAVSSPAEPAGPIAASAAGSNRALAATLQLAETGLAPVHALATSLGTSGKLTRAGVVMGTPDYMPPEVFRGEQANRRSDVYSLGALLYELCAGKAPFHDVPYKQLPHHVQDHDAPRLSSIASGVDERFATIIDRCLARQPGARFASADELRDALEQLTPAARPSAIPEGNPYRGLAPFEAEHRALFFGRSGAIRGIVERLRTEPFVLVAGDSGVGKSSLCRAGVMPAVEQGALGEGRSWQLVAIVPGRRPVATLAAGLAALVGRDDDEVATLIRRDPPLVAQILRKQLGRERGLVLFIDQLEELLTLSDLDDALATGTALAELAAGSPGLRLLATVRGDFLTRLASLPEIGDEVSRALYLLRPLSPEAMREAIVGPAEAKGFRFETDSLVETLVRSSNRAEAGLPLLQFALAELWEARDESARAITENALVGIGGVEGALERHADGVIAALLPGQREAARRIFTRLVTLEGTRSRKTEQELGASEPKTRAALDALVRGRLLVPRDVGDGVTAYEVAHEALLTGWRTLRTWLDEQVEHRAVKHRVEAAAAEWERAAHAPDALWNARRLAEIGVLTPDDLSAREVDFIAASRRAVVRKRIVRVASAAGVLLLVIGVYVGLRMKQARDTDKEVSGRLREAHATYEATKRRHEELAALRARALERFDANGDDAERLWEDGRRLSAELDHGYGEASQTLEVAIHRGGNDRADVRALMADVLFERALLADEDHRTEARDELLQRLAVYDEGGARRRHWTTPARLVINASPAHDPKIVVRLITSDARHHLTATDGAPAASGGAVLDATLAPGSYLASIAGAGLAPVSVPLFLERGSSVTIDVPLLSERAVPAGFAYVPAGEFLFGTSDEALRKQFYDTVPLHRRKTDAFLISRTETTFGDWIAFLDALPPGPERDARLPKSGAAGLQGALALTATPDGWQLTIRPTTTTYVASVGVPLVYAARDRRREQDWRRLPVSGVSALDAEAYTAWLARTGRVPGARLCSELEWERAARGADGRRFPGGDELSPDDADFEPTYGVDPATRGPDEVGAHPASRSPFGVDDMSGNVWEWVRSAAHEGEYLARGGAYAFDAVASVSYKRELVEPSLRDITLGLRVCATPPGGR